MITADIQQLEPGGRVTVFELDASSVGADQLWFHQHLQAGVIWWQGQQYGAWPIEATGFARTSDQQPAPRLRVGNGDGRIGAMCRIYDDLVGARLIRRQTLVKYLDASNFPGENRIRWSVSPADRWTVEGGGQRVALPAVTIDGVTFYPASIGSNGLTWHRLTVPSNTGMVAGTSVIFTFLFAFGTSGNVRLSVRNTTAATDSIIIGSNISDLRIWQVTAGPMQILSVTAKGGGVVQLVALMTFDAAGSWTASIGPNTTVVGATAIAYGIQAEFANAPQGFFVPTQAQIIVGGFNPTADSNEHFEDEIWFIERKVAETKEMVEFELATAIDLNGEVLPGRQIMSNVCTWLLRGGYRGPYCSYTGSAYFDINDNPVSDPGQDVCAGLVRSCKRRFGDNNEIPYGGFPAAGLVRT